MVDRHTAIKESLASYALGALDAREVAALEAHLRTCKSCTADLAAYQRITGGLLRALPPQAPPAALKHRLQQRLARETRPTTPASRWSFGRLALAGAFALLIGLNLLSLLQTNSIRQAQAEQEERSTSSQTAIAMLAYPGTQVVTFDQNGVAGSLLVDKQRNLLAVFAWHLPPTPAAKTYQVWLIDPQDNRTSGGFLTPETGYPFATTVIASPAPLAGFTSLGVTLEPQGGSPGPTGPKIFGVAF
jgi:anti-sigma-K factor RskA